VLLTRGLAFGAVAIGGAAAGATASGLVSAPVLLAAFAVLLLVIAGVMAARQLRSRRGRPGAHLESHAADPIITVSPSFACHCPRALKVLATATVVGLLTGFLGVGGGFLVVPALVLALGLPMSYAVGTSWWSSPSPRPQRSRSARAPARTRVGGWWRCSPPWLLAAAGPVPG
jgi:uncharacterized membrane protein YfcA